MSDYHEISLRRYEEELEQRYQEEYEKATNPNPNFYWFIITTEWEDYAYSEEEKNELIQSAKDAGLRYSCTRHKEGEQY
tara:strand:- start:7 stop:243 length:237 start_codon:yes stop_codon:yes gene_type:complete